MTNEKFMTVGTNGGHKVVDVVISSNEFLILRDDGKINQFGLGDISNTNIFHNRIVDNQAKYGITSTSVIVEIEGGDFWFSARMLDGSVIFWGTLIKDTNYDYMYTPTTADTMAVRINNQFDSPKLC